LAKRFFDEFLCDELIDKAVIDDFRCECIGSDTFGLIEF
jgi:hypothetical protein